MYVFWIAAVLLASTMHFYATVAVTDDVDFKPFDCHRDICTSRRQFCSESERRCKYCLPAHCLDPTKTPKECRPLCSEPASLSTTSIRPSSTTTTEDLTTSAGILSPGQSSAQSTVPSNGNVYDHSSRPDGDENGTVIPSWVFYIGVVVLLLLLILLVVVNLLCTCSLQRRLPSSSSSSLSSSSPRRGAAGEVRGMEEGQALLGEGGWGSKSSSRTVGGVSQVSTQSSALHPFKPPAPPTPPTPAGQFGHHTGQDSKGVQTDPIPPNLLSPPYTARTASQQNLLERHGDAAAIVQASRDGTAGHRHFKGYEYRLLDDGAAATSLDGRHGDHLPLSPLTPPPLPRLPPPSSLPPISSYSVVVAEPGHQDRPVVQDAEDTCPKSL